jgi:[ribosomal protein S5]-alanine N-acetyltransferase
MLSGDEEVMRYIRPVSRREESDKFLLENIGSYKKYPHRGRWAVIEKLGSVFIGSFAIIPIPSMPEKIQLGYSLIPSKWGLGYATELTAAGLKYFFDTDELNEIYGVTEIPNKASQKVLLKAGFKAAGTFWEEGKELKLFIARRAIDHIGT